MTEPKRLLESGAGACDAFEADLLRAARGDAMSAASKRALVAAALGGTLAASAGATATAHAATAAKVGASTLAKWMVLGVLGCSAAVSAGLLLGRTPSTQPTASAPVMTTAPPAAIAPRAPVAPRAETPAMPSAHLTAPIASSASTAPNGPDPAPSARSAPGAAAPASAAHVPSANSGDDLAAEAALLDEAREAVARRDGAAALVVLTEHARAFPRPALADEAFVLRAEALSAQGDGARLRALATPWLASHPASPYAPRVRRALAQASPAPSGAATP